jgi:hypothetical protein
MRRKTKFGDVQTRAKVRALTRASCLAARLDVFWQEIRNGGDRSLGVDEQHEELLAHHSLQFRQPIVPQHLLLEFQSFKNDSSTPTTARPIHLSASLALSGEKTLAIKMIGSGPPNIP